MKIISIIVIVMLMEIICWIWIGKMDVMVVLVLFRIAPRSLHSKQFHSIIPTIITMVTFVPMVPMVSIISLVTLVTIIPIIIIITTMVSLLHQE